jgi:predicted AAA+ superfamily ATPase
MSAAPYLSRQAEASLNVALADSPVVLLHGPRQCGKSTLARHVAEAKGYDYISFDDAIPFAAASSDPSGFVADLPAHVVLDEIQRVPHLLTAIKSVVDRDRSPGRFLLTGSANVLLLPTLADSLAGRMSILRLHPLSQLELVGQSPWFLDAVFGGGFKARPYDRLGRDLADRIAAGGYPAALARTTATRRASWYRDYVEALVQRDVRDMSRIASLDALPRLLELAAGQTARLINVSDLAAPFQLSRPTIKDYVTLLERVFLLEHLPPWHNNRLSRLVKTPKVHLGDTGVACALLGHDADSLWDDRELLGQMLETFVFQELRRQASWRDDSIRFHHMRDRDGVEVDVVMERSGRELAGVEIKASGTVTSSDFRGLRKLREAMGKRFVSGIVLYDGEMSVSFGDRLSAVPISALWSGKGVT